MTCGKGKIAYDGERAARIAAVGIERRSHKKGPVFRYFCHACQAWHLTRCKPKK